jgi:hypothetical protein
MLDGQKRLRVPMPNIHGGSGSISKGYLTQIRKALMLKNRQFEELVDCSLTSKNFETIIRKLGI